MTYLESMCMNLRPPTGRPGKQWEEMIPMRDGVKLRTLFYMPDTEGPWPVLFSRTPYLKNQEIYDAQGRLFSERGYGFILQYCRGTGGSEGEWAPFENEKEDGTDALKRLEQRDEIKSIGLYGFSYVAFTQWVLLDHLTPKVKTAYIVHFGTDRYHQMYSGGLFRHDIYTPWAKDNSGTGKKLPYEASLDAGLCKPHIEADRAVWGMDLPWYREWISHTDYEDPFWKESFWEDLKAIPSRVSIPVFLGCGWYDHHFGGMMEAYRSLSDYGKAHCRLVIGPWVHTKEPCIDTEDTEDAFRQGVHGYEQALRWMDLCLKDRSVPKGEAIVYGMGRGWQSMDQWPGEAGKRILYLAEDNRLSESRPDSPGHADYIYDPAEVQRTHGSECMCYAPLEERGSRFQPSPGYRPDVLSFVSHPLSAPCTIRGSMKVNLTVSSDASDTAFIVRVMGITPDGRSFNIRTGATTLRYRNNAERAQDYVPGTPVRCVIDLWDINWVLPEGSRLRLDISSSSFPEYSIHMNTSEPWALQKEAFTAHQRIWMGGDCISSLELPVVE